MLIKATTPQSFNDKLIITLESSPDNVSEFIKVHGKNEATSNENVI